MRVITAKKCYAFKLLYANFLYANELFAEKNEIIEYDAPNEFITPPFQVSASKRTIEMEKFFSCSSEEAREKFRNLFVRFLFLSAMR